MRFLAKLYARGWGFIYLGEGGMAGAEARLLLLAIAARLSRALLQDVWCELLWFPPFRKVRERMGHPGFVVVLTERLDGWATRENRHG